MDDELKSLEFYDANTDTWHPSEPTPEQLASSIQAGQQWRATDYRPGTEIIPANRTERILQEAREAAAEAGDNPDKARAIMNAYEDVQEIMSRHPELERTPPSGETRGVTEKVPSTETERVARLNGKVEPLKIVEATRARRAQNWVDAGIFNSDELTALKKDFPDLYKVIETTQIDKDDYESINKAVEKYNKAVSAQQFVQQQELKYEESLTPIQKFERLQRRGDIPQEATFDHIDEEGNIHYRLPPQTITGPAVMDDYQRWKAERSVSDTITPTSRSPEIISQYEQQYMRELRQQTKEGLIGMTWIYGTIYFWKDMSPMWQSISIASDVFILGSFAKAAIIPRIIARLAPNVRLAQEAKAAIAVGRAEERAAIKAVTTRRVLKAYDEWVKATNDYTDTLSTIRATEKKAIEETKLLGAAKGKPPYTPNLNEYKLAQEALPRIEARVVQAGDDFAQLQKEALAKRPGVIGKAGIEQPLENFGRESARDIKSTIDNIFDKIPDLRTLNRQAKQTAKKLEAVTDYYDKQLAGTRSVAERKTIITNRDTEISRLEKTLIKIQQQAKVARSGQFQQLYNERLETLGRIEAINKDLARPSRQLTPERTSMLKKERIRLAGKVAKLDKQIADAMKNLETDWAPPIPRGTGRTIVSPGKLGTYKIRYTPMGAIREEIAYSTGAGVSGAKGYITPFERARIEREAEKAREREAAIKLGTWHEWEAVPATSVPFVMPKESLKATTRTIEKPIEKEATESEIESKVAAEVRPQIKAETKTEVQPKIGTKVATQAQIKAETKAQIKALPLTKAQIKTQAQIKEETGMKTQTKTGIKEPPIPKTPPPKILPTEEKQERDKKMRQLLAERGGLAWPQGELRDKVWHIVVKPYSQATHFIVVGEKPEGAQLFPGPREAYKSIVQLYGKGPQRPTKLEGGAVDPVIYSESGKTKIAFIKDTTNQRRRKMPRTRITQSSLAPDIVEVTVGGRRRRHLKK